MKRFTTLALFAAATLTAGNAAAINVIANGGFEDGTGTDADGWQEAGVQPATRDSTNPNSGSWALKLEAIGGPGSGPNSVGLQNSIADGGQLGLAELSTVDISFQWASAFGPGGVAFVQAQILNESGAPVGSTTGLIALPENGGSYTEVVLPTLNVPAFGDDPNDVYAVFLEFSAAAGAFDGSFSGGFIDDVVAEGTLIPEPTSLALLGMGGLLAVRRRRA